MIQRALVALALPVLVAVAVAQPVAPARPGAPHASAESGPSWASLSPSQRAALAPLESQWRGLDVARKTKWLVVAGRMPSMPDEERERVRARMAEWARLTPAERGRARQNFQELRNLPVEDRHALWEAYRSLPEADREQLAQRARSGPVAASASPAAGDGKPKVQANPRAVAVKPVTPTVVQAKPGGSTTLVTRVPTPPLHHQPGMPKILASKEFVNPTTLLPSRGPQGAAALAPLPREAAAAPAPAAAASAAVLPAAASAATAASGAGGAASTP